VGSFDEITNKVVELVASDKVLISKKHIEQDRAYREIYGQDVKVVLESGKVVSVSADLSFRWVGSDSAGRDIQLVCRMADKDNNDTLQIVEAEELFVQTAYEIGTNASDETTRSDWLLKNPNWRLKDNGCVERVR
jgi:hypothetical protein